MKTPEPVLKLITESDCVVAYFAGHDHAGGYAFQDGIHHITVKGMVEAPIHNAYAVIEVSDAAINEIGYGKEPSRQLKLNGIHRPKTPAPAGSPPASDIRVHNADSGPYIRGTFCTLDGIRLTADAERVCQRGYTGHHGITFYANDCLCTNFSIETRFIHDLTVQSELGAFSNRAVPLT